MIKINIEYKKICTLEVRILGEYKQIVYTNNMRIRNSYTYFMNYLLYLKTTNKLTK